MRTLHRPKCLLEYSNKAYWDPRCFCFMSTTFRIVICESYYSLCGRYWISDSSKKLVILKVTYADSKKGVRVVLLTRNLLTLNKTKCNFVTFGSHQKLNGIQDFSVQLEDTCIERTVIHVQIFVSPLNVIIDHNNNELYLHDHTSTYSFAKAFFSRQNYIKGQLRYFDNNLWMTNS